MQMLTKDPQYRLALDGVMRHAWTTGWNSNPLPTMASIGNEVGGGLSLLSQLEITLQPACSRSRHRNGLCAAHEYRCHTKQ